MPTDGLGKICQFPTGPVHMIGNKKMLLGFFSQKSAAVPAVHVQESTLRDLWCTLCNFS